jgi:uncharacterized membrane protein
MGQTRLANPNTRNEHMGIPRAHMVVPRPRFHIAPRWLLAIIALPTTSGVVVAQPLPCRYEIQDVIQAPDAGPGFPSPTNAVAISPNGRYVVGSFNPGAIGFDRAFAYDTATRQFIVLPLPAGGFQSYCNDVNDAGLAVGSYWLTTGTAVQRGYVYDIPGGQYLHELLPLPGAAWCAANAINSNGIVCGFRSIGSKGDPVNPLSAFLWSERDGFTDLGTMNGPNSSAEDIAEDGTVVGWTGAGEATTGTRGFVHRGKHPTILPPVDGGTTSSLSAVNGKGESACGRGLKMLPGGQIASQAFVWRNGSITPIGALPGTTIGFAFGMLRDDYVVGMGRSLQPAEDRAYIWQHGLLRDLNDLVDGPAHLSSAQALAENGRVVATGSYAGNVVVFTLDPVYVEGDAYPDCVVDIDDLIAVILAWDELQSPADVNGDGIVNVDDMILVIRNWTSK